MLGTVAALDPGIIIEPPLTNGNASCDITWADHPFSVQVRELPLNQEVAPSRSAHVPGIVRVGQPHIDYPPARISPSGSAPRPASLGEPVRLGESVAASGSYPPETIGTAIHAFFAADDPDRAADEDTSPNLATLPNWRFYCGARNLDGSVEHTRSPVNDVMADNAISLLHCADLHLTADPTDREYSLSVLDEVIAIANDRSVDYVLLAGDTFDDYHNVEELRSEFRERIDDVDAKVLMVPGNHEQLRADGRMLSALDLGDVMLTEELPYRLLHERGVEFLLLPFRKEYGNYVEWSLPKKSAQYRVAIGHGLVAGVSCTFSDEEDEGALDWDIFERCKVDYAAMGHVHGATEDQRGERILAYPGSARVWRKGERGPRHVLHVELGDRIERELVVLRAAGQYLPIKLPLRFDGSCPEAKEILKTCTQYDWVDIEISGLVEDEHTVRSLEEALRQQLENRVRRIDIDRSAVDVAAAISAQPLAAQFLELWQQQEPDDDSERDVWYRSRELGLMMIKSRLEARQ